MANNKLELTTQKSETTTQKPPNIGGRKNGHLEILSQDNVVVKKTIRNEHITKTTNSGCHSEL